ncbi:MAG: acetyl ornithine aminotransferase family protein [Thermoprotei archaeon]|nr:MAG: acetyl ornithine aminotransferase family protein [Thermoprotei archaeon]HDI74460.1 acetyl ornithine aminotransferase family protein [Thermoprotei archaeon]
MNKIPLIKVEPPGPKAREIIGEDEKYLMQSFIRYYPLVAAEARGAVVVDVDGNKYIDFNSGLAVMSIGHCHPKVVEAIKRQSEKLLHYSLTDFYYEEPVKLARKLVEIAPGSFDKRVFFCNSGAESIEGALKTARGYFKGSRPYILAYIGSFHGRTLGALSLTSSKPVQRRYFSPMIPCVEHVPYPYCYRCPWKQTFPDCGYWCVDFIEEWYFKRYVPPEEVACIVFEPIAGEGGYIVPPPEYWKRIRKLCDKYGILMVDDEVQAGMGRTGRWFAIEHWNTEPDIICVAKAIASGLPLGAIIGRKEVMSLPKGSHATTFGGNPVSCAAANAVIDVIKEEKLLSRATRLGEKILKFFEDLKTECKLIGDVRGKGLMIGIELVKDRKSKEPAKEELQKILRDCFKNGVLAIGAGISTLRLAPPLTIPEDLLDRGLEIIASIIKKYS